MAELSIVIPTYNEEENVRPLVQRIKESANGISFEIIFVDDSDDRTPVIIQEMTFGSKEKIYLIHRQGEERQGGLSTAVIRRFREARGKYLCVMDADLQHPPEKAFEMVKKAEISKADIVVASRYIKGGSYEGLSGAWRKSVSVGLKEFTRLAFYPRLKKVTDPLSGFFLVRRKILKEEKLDPLGFKILLEILMRCPWETVTEFPYHFSVRENGKSKATAKQGKDFLLHTGRLFFSSPGTGRFLKFGIVGGAVAVFSLAFLYVLVEIFSIRENIAYFIQMIVALQLNFNLNKELTWKDRRGKKGEYWNRWAKFHGTRAFSALLNQGLFVLLNAMGMYYMFAAVFCLVFSTVINYFMSDRFVFLPLSNKKGALK